MQDLPGLVIRPMCPALAGEFFSHQGTLHLVFEVNFILRYNVHKEKCTQVRTIRFSEFSKSEGIQVAAIEHYQSNSLR